MIIKEEGKRMREKEDEPEEEKDAREFQNVKKKVKSTYLFNFRRCGASGEVVGRDFQVEPGGGRREAERQA